MTLSEVAAIAEGAGFACDAQLGTVVALAVAASGLDPDAVNIHPEQGFRPDGSQHMDRGLWQISSYSFPDYTDEETFDPVAAASIVYELSGGGADFTLWDAYNSGAVQRHVDEPHNGWPAVGPAIAEYCGEAAANVRIEAAAPNAASPTGAAIDDFLQRRVRTIADVGPSLRHYLDRFNDRGSNGVFFAPLSPMNFAALASGGGEAAFDAVMASPKGDWAVWAEGTVGRYREGHSGAEVNGLVGLFQGGLDFRLGERAIFGVMVAADAAREVSDDLGYRVGGLGWMAGPYAAIRLGGSVIVDAKFLWGETQNSVQPMLTYTDQFTTSRWLATARISGEAALGPVLFRPEVAYVHFREIQAAYVDGNGDTVPEQRIDTARLTFGPEMAIPIAAAGGGRIEPFVGMQGVWDISGAQLSARLNGGLFLTSAHGLSFSLSAGLGGLFIPDSRSWSLQAGLTIPLR